MLRVVHIVEAFCGGILTHLRTILPRLATCDCEVSLICSLERDWPRLAEAAEEFRRAGVMVHVVKMTRAFHLWRDPASLVGLRRILTEGEFDVVHTHGSKAGALGRVAAKMAGIPVVVHTPHCFAFLRCPSPIAAYGYRATERALGRLTDVLIGVSQAEADVARGLKILPPDRCAVVENALDDVVHRPEQALPTRRIRLREYFGVREGQRVVTIVARLVAYKGIATFIEAAGACKARNAVFLLAGDGPLEGRLRHMLREAGLGEKVRLLGHVEAAEDLYEASDVVVSCSQAEGQSYALLEAMRAGRAIVATAAPGNRDLLEDGRTGCLVSPSPKEIASAIDRLLADDDLLQRVGAAARCEFLARPTPREQARRLADLYRQRVEIKKAS